MRFDPRSLSLTGFFLGILFSLWMTLSILPGAALNWLSHVDDYPSTEYNIRGGEAMEVLDAGGQDGTGTVQWDIIPWPLCQLGSLRAC